MREHVCKSAAHARGAGVAALERYAGLDQFYADLDDVSITNVGNVWLDRAHAIVGRCEAARPASEARRRLCAPSVQSVLSRSGPEGTNTVGLDEELRRIAYPDAVGAALERGLPVAGPLPNTRLWAQIPSREASITIDALRSRGSDLVALRKRCGKVNDREEVQKEIWRQTKSEAGACLSRPEPFDWYKSIHRVISPRFGIEQMTSTGRVRTRIIDDFKASGVNAATSVPETIRHDHVDDLARVAAAVWRAGHDVEFIKADFKGAYRTVPLEPSQIDLATLLVRDTDQCAWTTVQQWALPFGAVASVYGWERVGGAITAILRNAGLPVLRYVDDLFLAVPRGMGDAAREALEMIVAALGWTLEPSKTEGPSREMVILGMHVGYAGDGVIQIEPDARKAKVWISSIEDALASDELSATAAAKLAGRLLFARSAAFGRVGAAQLRRLFIEPTILHRCSLALLSAGC